MSIGDNIRAARLNKGLNQKELAELLKENGINVGNTTISNWENGTSKPDPDTIEIICKILGVDGNYILGFYKQSESTDTTNIYDLFVKLLKEKGIIDKNDNISKEDFERLMKFIDNNKDFLIKKDRD